MPFEAEYQALKNAKEAVTQRTRELAEAVVDAALAEEALEELKNPPESLQHQSVLSPATRKAAAEKALTATVQRLLQKRSRHIP